MTSEPCDHEVQTRSQSVPLEKRPRATKRQFLIWAMTAAFVAIFVFRRSLLSLLFGVGIVIFGVSVFMRRFGRPAIALVATVCTIIVAFFVWEYVQDMPNAQTLADVRGLGASSVIFSGSLFVGNITHVTFGETTTDNEVERFCNLDGLSHLFMLRFHGSQITDRSVEHLLRLQGLRRLDLDRIHLTEEALIRLIEGLPACIVYVDDEAMEVEYVNIPEDDSQSALSNP